ncbi:MAG TPA: SDR family NAD(P)-dependent oxidoreductase [bacterium]|nr:SDR family NAD(P)-dependent oxidoreductase [bacterium]
METERVLVTGGAGFIGSNLVQELLRKGYAVTVIDNLSTGYLKNLEGLEDKIGFVRGDVRDPHAVALAMVGASGVFHLAASVGNIRSIEDPLQDADVNVRGTINVLSEALAAGIKKMVVSSSAAIYGELVYNPVDEKHPCEPDSPYGVSKLAAEKYALCFSRMHDFDVACLRYFNVYGENQRYDAYGNVIPIFADRLAERKPLTIYGDGEQSRDFINVRDVVRANISAYEKKDLRGAFNIGSGRAITINALAEMFFGVTGDNAGIVHATERHGEVRHSLSDISVASRGWGFAPSVDMEEGLRRYWEWFCRDKKVGRE